LNVQLKSNLLNEVASKDKGKHDFVDDMLSENVNLKLFIQLYVASITVTFIIIKVMLLDGSE
jgi:hypothetical protein